jgi:hypothetical protein
VGLGVVLQRQLEQNSHKNIATKGPTTTATKAENQTNQQPNTDLQGESNRSPKGNHQNKMASFVRKYQVKVVVALRSAPPPGQLHRIELLQRPSITPDGSPSGKPS